MQTLNLAAHCLEAWETIPIESPFGYATRLLATELRAAPKFLLGDGGRPLDDESSIARLFPDLHLPYPCVALEYLATGAIAEHEVKSSKRIALAWDLRLGCPQAFMELAGGDPSPRPSFLVQSVSYVDKHDFWMPVLGFVEIQLDSAIGRVTRQEVDPHLYELVSHRMAPRGRTFQTYGSLVYPYAIDVMTGLGKDQAHAVVSADTGDEVLATMAFAALTSCANVSFETLPASAALNKKRESKGRQPLFDVRVLMVGESGSLRSGPRPGAPALPGSHASPRTHLRRGHVRRLDEKTVWINAAVVNPANQEAPVPRYRLERDT